MKFIVHCPSPPLLVLNFHIFYQPVKVYSYGFDLLTCIDLCTCIAGELYKLWAAHQKQRIDTSSLFQQQLCRELDALEKEVKATQGNEEKASNQLKLCFKAMTKSLHKQQNQWVEEDGFSTWSKIEVVFFFFVFCRMDRLRALHVTYHKQVEHLEQTQERQRVTAQKSLKKEMHSLQKRLLEDSVSLYIIWPV